MRLILCIEEAVDPEVNPATVSFFYSVDVDSAVVSIDLVGSAVDPEPIDVYPPGKGRRPPID